MQVSLFRTPGKLGRDSRAGDVTHRAMAHCAAKDVRPDGESGVSLQLRPSGEEGVRQIRQCSMTRSLAADWAWECST
jgi:hypothetical protein